MSRADSRINGFFARTDIPRLKKLLVEQICAGTGGPCTYTGRSMQAAHKGMNITDAQFNALVEDLQKSLNKFKVPREGAERPCCAVLGPMKPQIVGPVARRISARRVAPVPGATAPRSPGRYSAPPLPSTPKRSRMRDSSSSPNV